MWDGLAEQLEGLAEQLEALTSKREQGALLAARFFFGRFPLPHNLVWPQTPSAAE